MRKTIIITIKYNYIIDPKVGDLLHLIMVSDCSEFL